MVGDSGHLDPTAAPVDSDALAQPPGTEGLRAFFGDRGPTAGEIDQLLPESKGQLGLVANCINQGLTDLREIVDSGAAANTGAAANLVVNIRAIRNGEIPEDAPSRARLALGAARSFLKQHADRMSQSARNHLNAVIEQLLDVVADPAAQAREEAELQGKADVLEEALVAKGPRENYERVVRRWRLGLVARS